MSRHVHLDTNEWSNDNSSLVFYFKEINRIPLLSRCEEQIYGRRAAEGDQQAIQKMVSANLRFVVKVAKNFRNRGVSFTDLISEGNMGLLRAIKHYDVDRGYRFISYAVWWIRQALLKAVNEQPYMIRLPLNRINELLHIHQAKERLLEEQRGQLLIDRIAAELRMKPHDVEDLLNISRELISLESPPNDHADNVVVADFVEGPDYAQPEMQLIEHSLQDDMDSLLSVLTTREANVVRWRFGLGNQRPKSLREIGHIYNLTKERIRQIEKQALRRLHNLQHRKMLESYMH